MMTTTTSTTMMMMDYVIRSWISGSAWCSLQSWCSGLFWLYFWWQWTIRPQTSLEERVCRTAHTKAMLNKERWLHSSFRWHTCCPWWWCCSAIAELSTC